ncbi:MAG: hypothetical protein GF346_07940, partial [Candidatus Eisenbacteria bacterium]|nr:hypothetical protein [Candidatus Latescibacterota bacterium]MBD3302364.1 hypothetical protein [Candidatus Eisenbacteria bacterium]
MMRVLEMICVALLLLGLFAGCEKSEEITGTDPPDVAEEPTEEEPPDSLALDPTLGPILANGVDEIVVQATIVDRQGRGVPDVGVAFTTTHGQIDPFATTDGEGRALATLRSEVSVSDVVAMVRAEVPGNKTGAPRGEGLRILLIPERLDRAAVLRLLEEGAANAEGIVSAPQSLGGLRGAAEVRMIGITLALEANPSVIPADGISTSRIVASLFETTSRVPLEGERIRFGTTAGTVTGRVQTDASGTAIADLTGLPGTTSAQVTAFYGEGFTADADVQFSPLALVLTADRYALVADGVSRSQITARLLTQNGNPVVGGRVEFSTTLGTIGSPGTTDQEGAAAASLLASTTTGSARVIAAFGPSVADTVEIDLIEPVSPSELLLRAEPTSLPADGAGEAILIATLLDENGDLMAYPTPVDFSIVSGSGWLVGSRQTSEGGVARATYVAGTAAGTVEIRAVSGALQRSVEVELVPLVPANIELQPGATSLLANGVELTTIQALVTDEVGHPVAAGTGVTFTTSLGMLEGPTPTDADGIATVRLRSAPFVTGTARVTASSGVAQATLDVDFVSEEPAHIEVVHVDPPSIGVFGAGDRETAMITCEVQDRNGIPVDAAHAAQVDFAIVPVGEETDATVHPATGTTNPYGWVATTVNAGVISGTVEVIATSGSIVSEPIRVAIHGGQPDPAHFSISFERVNIAGLVFDGIRNRVTARVGDVHGNPVPDSTSVWFSAEYGLVQGSAGTSEHGEATVDEVTAGPRPPIPGGDGLVRICAQTVSRDGDQIETCGHVMWSGPTIVEILSPAP